MCGLAGILDLRRREEVRPEWLRTMCSLLAHRGPDDQGIYVDGNLGLGHRRLAVIDLSPAGHQPMVSRDGRLAVVYNGTIFNYLELTAELRAAGHHFASRCDTEVLIHGWEEWGASVVEHLNGHFAFALWDAVERRLHLVRDRFGTKPLYYANLGGLWLFASEIKAILAHPDCSFGINHDALCEYFTFQNLFRFHTLFEGVNLLPPASVMSIDAETGDCRRHTWWDFDFSRPDTLINEREATTELRRLMVQAVQRQLVADVPVGAYLSGGMDSGSIVAIASRKLEHMHTFTCGWHMGGVSGVEASFDERVGAEKMASLFGTEHYEQVVGHSDVARVLPQLVWHLEDLRLGMCYGNYYIARLASRFVKVCLAGAGGDELFGGYPWRYYRVSGSLGREEFFDNYYAYWQRLVPDDLRRDFFTPQALRAMSGTDMKQVLKRVFTFHPGLGYDTPEDHIANSLYFEAKTFLHGLLVLGDRLAMAHGLEERLPFLDNDLVDFAQKIPVRHKLRSLEEWKRTDENIPAKIGHYYALHDDGKNILRQAMTGFIPAEVTAGRKQGFSSPDASWYRGPALEYVKGLVLGRKALLHDFIPPEQIRATLEEHCGGLVNRRLRIWSLVCFEIWLRTFHASQGRELGLDARELGVPPVVRGETSPEVMACRQS
ncbi:MAG: asparagine synthase (glutamine-hydrolyzing) [Pseudomonadota bacterium]